MAVTDLPRQPVYAVTLPDSRVLVCDTCEKLIWPQPCVFCEIIRGGIEPAWVLDPGYWPDAVAFRPSKPLAEGHVLVVPKAHVKDFRQDPEVSAAVMRRAAELVRWTKRSMNLISTMGKEAGQEVFHLHLHLIPREAGDGIRLLTRKATKL